LADNAALAARRCRQPPSFIREGPSISQSD
jgi:hypothetical protein